jgi:hypothetical protein
LPVAGLLLDRTRYDEAHKIRHRAALTLCGCLDFGPQVVIDRDRKVFAAVRLFRCHARHSKSYLRDDERQRRTSQRTAFGTSSARGLEGQKNQQGRGFLGNDRF